MAGVVNFGLGILHHDLEVAAVLEFRPHPFRVFVQLGGIVGLGKDVFQEDGVRDPDRLQVLHGPAQDPRADMLVADKRNLAHADLGALLHHKGNAHFGGRDGPDFGAHGGKLPPMLREQFPDRDLRFLYLCRIVLAFGRESYLALLETVQHIALRNRAQTQIIDLADGRALLDVNVKAPALGSLLALEADVFEISGIPQGVKVAFQGGRVIDIAGAGKNASPHGFRRDTPVPVDHNLGD